MDKLIKILVEIRPDVDFVIEENLIDEGILDSMDIVSIISELNDVYNINIKVSELTPENFNSAESIYEMCKKLEKNNN